MSRSLNCKCTAVRFKLECPSTCCNRLMPRRFAHGRSHMNAGNLRDQKAARSDINNEMRGKKGLFPLVSESHLPTGGEGNERSNKRRRRLFFYADRGSRLPPNLSFVEWQLNNTVFLTYPHRDLQIAHNPLIYLSWSPYLIKLSQRLKNQRKAEK